MRVFLFALLAVCAVGIFAFSPSNEKFNKQFKYKGPSLQIGYLTPANWDVGETHTPCPESGAMVCRVTPHNPSIDTEAKLVAEIIANGFTNITVHELRP